MSIEAMKMALDAMSEYLFDEQWYAAKEALRKAIQEEALRNVQRIGQEIEQDWSTQEAALESLREHMARIKELEAQIERMKSEKPVAWMDSTGHPKHLRHIQSSEERRLYGKLQPLYLHPQPEREWIGLTDEEIDGLLDFVDHYNFPEDLIVYTQAKLKEKNT
jgi:hypothetical protein